MLNEDRTFRSYQLGPCQTNGLAAAVAKRIDRCGTAFERGYIDSYVKRWLMSHERSSRLAAAGETAVLIWNRCGQAPMYVSDERFFRRRSRSGLISVLSSFLTQSFEPTASLELKRPGRFYHVTRAGYPLLNCRGSIAANPIVWHDKSGLAASG